MERVLLNTLYLMQSDGYLHLDNDTIRYEREKQTVARIPLHHLSAVVVQANILITPGLLQYCSEHNIAVTWLNQQGEFIGGLQRPTGGNVLLRLSQVEAYQIREKSYAIAYQIVRGKIRNARHTLARRERDATAEQAQELQNKKEELDRLLTGLPQAADHDALRGYEGMAARVYFSAFPAIFNKFEETFHFESRQKRPPRDPLNALLSFAYTLAVHDCQAALEGVGLDPQIGYLHEIRPGRPSLALDLVEELRPSFVDRLVFSLINRRQITATDFDPPNMAGAVLLNKDGKRTFLTAYQKRKEQLVPHPLFEENLPFGLVPHIQARLLARYLRGDIEAYPPFEYR